MKNPETTGKIPLRVRMLREENHLTQTWVAEYLQTSQAMYSRYERGTNEMPLHHLMALCRLYNVSADFFLDTAPDPQRKQKRVSRRLLPESDQ